MGRVKRRRGAPVDLWVWVALRTTEGRYAKIRINAITHADNAMTNGYQRSVTIDYVTFALVGE